jgi:hypothetical protein
MTGIRVQSEFQRLGWVAIILAFPASENAGKLFDFIRLPLVGNEMWGSRDGIHLGKLDLQLRAPCSNDHIYRIYVSRNRPHFQVRH